MELAPHSTLSPDDLRLWFQPCLTRAEMPHHITIEPIAMLGTGKKRRL